jgi:hypothetical protein
MKLDGLVAATNDLLKLGRNSSTMELRGVCVSACRELTVMSDDDSFHALVSKQSALAYEDDEVSRVLDELSRFQAFVSEELRVLMTAGLDLASAEALLDQAQNFRQTLRSIRTNPQTLKIGLYQLRDEACDLVKLFAAASADGERRRKARIVLRRAGWVLGGASLVIANTTTSWITGVYAGVSVTAGTGLIGYGIRGG